MASNLLELTDLHFKDTNVNFRALSAIMVSSIYYLVLHAKSTDSTFCEINIRSEEGMKEIMGMINLMLDWAFDQGNK